MRASDERRLFKALAGEVRKAMKASGVGLRELARLADVPVGTLHHWIGDNGDKASRRKGDKQRAGGPRFAIVAAVVHVLGVDLSTIVHKWATRVGAPRGDMRH